MSQEKTAKAPILRTSASPNTKPLKCVSRVLRFGSPVQYREGGLGRCTHGTASKAAKYGQGLVFWRDHGLDCGNELT